MDRQWQRRGRGRYDTLPSQADFVRELPPLAAPQSAGAGMGGSTGDLYAMFSALHAQQRAPEVRVSAGGGFHYLLASLPQEAVLGGKAGVRQQQAAQVWGAGLQSAARAFAFSDGRADEPPRRPTTGE